MHTNPFRPGYGRMPPHIAGRDPEQREINSCIADLAAGVEPQSILMVGPRRRSTRFTRMGLRKAVESVLREHEGNPERTDAFTSQVLHTGFLWKPMGSADLTPGLPSFVNHVLERCGYPPDPE